MEAVGSLETAYPLPPNNLPLSRPRNLVERNQESMTKIPALQLGRRTGPAKRPGLALDSDFEG